MRRKVTDGNLSYRLNDSWRVRSAVAVTYDDIDFSQFFGGSLDETPGPTFGDFTNVPWFDHRRSKGGNVFVDLTGHVRKAGVEHTLLVGTDYYSVDFSDRGFVNGWAPVDTMNIFHPVFGRSTAVWSAIAAGQHSSGLDQRRYDGMERPVCAGSAGAIEQRASAPRRSLRLVANDSRQHHPRIRIPWKHAERCSKNDGA